MTDHIDDIWFVEDNSRLRRIIIQTLAPHFPESDIYDFATFETFQKHLHSLTHPSGVIILDIGLPGMSGLEGLVFLQKNYPNIVPLIFTVFDDPDKIFQAICSGAAGYLLKESPIESMPQHILEIWHGGRVLHPQLARKVITAFNRFIPKTEDYSLSAREKEVLQLMAEGKIKKEIADQLSLSEHTVNGYIRRIYDKLHVTTMHGAVAEAFKSKLIF
jgi:DNA-binding NarL/FixJ family response regulator